MADDLQAGCFNFKSLFRPRRSSSRRHTHVQTSASPVLPSESVKDQRLSEKEESHQVDHSYASCCAFTQPGTGDNIWRVDDHMDALPEYHAESRDDIYRPEVMNTIEKTIDELDAELRELSLKIHGHPEIMFEEKYAHDTLTAFMASHGFEVTRHYKDMSTAWRAVFTHTSSLGSRRSTRTLGINSEMDALPGIGHACGHNLIAVAGVGVALAVKVALEKHDISGNIVLLGTPAEEGGQGKATLIERGAYKEMDACIMCHPGPGTKHSAGLGSSLAFQGVEVEYFGHTAHASAAPWEGVNAFDAAMLAYSGVSVLRQQMKPSHRVHGVITGPGNLAANVIPDYTKMLWYIRAPSWDELQAFRERVLACFAAAATATGCKYKTTIHQAAYDLRQNSVLSHEFAHIIKARYNMETTLAEGAIGGSTDFGNVTYELPAIHPAYAIPTEPNGGNHTSGFTKAAKTPEAHAATMTVTKALALAGLRVLDDEDYYLKAKKAYDDGKTYPM